MASIDDLMATICADCPNVWAYSCACNGWCVKTGESLPDPPERDEPHTHCPRCGLNQDPCLCTMHGPPQSTAGDVEAVRRRFMELLEEHTSDHPWVKKYRETGR